MHFPSADLFKIAVATTHGANLITNLAAFQAHAVRRSIDWASFIRLGPGSIAGAAAGALLATHLDTAILELVFIAFAVALSARLLRRHRKSELKDAPSLAVWVTRSTAMGVLAALTGAGGVLPLFLKEYLPAHKVVGTTVAGCLIMSIPAAATYYAFSAPPAHCGSDCLGPIFLPGMFAAGIASSLAAPFGAWLSHALPPVRSQARLFGAASDRRRQYLGETRFADRTGLSLGERACGRRARAAPRKRNAASLDRRTCSQFMASDKSLRVVSKASCRG